MKRAGDGRKEKGDRRRQLRRELHVDRLYGIFSMPIVMRSKTLVPPNVTYVTYGSPLASWRFQYVSPQLSVVQLSLPSPG